MSSRQRWGWLMACVLAVLGIAGSSGAALSSSSPPPESKLLLIQATDFTGKAKVLSQKLGTKSSERQWGPGLRLGPARFLGVYTGSDLMSSAASAKAQIADFKSEYRRAGDRERLIRFFGEGLFEQGMGGEVKRSHAGPFSSAGVDAIQFMGTSISTVGTVRVGIAVVRVDRAIGTVLVFGLLGGELGRRDIVRVVALARQRMRSAFTIAVSSPPVVTGTPRTGDALTVDEGSWTGGPSSFTYAWSRCDAAGALCAPIAGATSRAYAADVADEGSTLRVAVTGTNTVSSRTAASRLTSPVAPV